jgi:hypothetical protein
MRLGTRASTGPTKSDQSKSNGRISMQTCTHLDQIRDVEQEELEERITALERRRGIA